MSRIWIKKWAFFFFSLHWEYNLDFWFYSMQSFKKLPTLILLAIFLSFAFKVCTVLCCLLLTTNYDLWYGHRHTLHCTIKAESALCKAGRFLHTIKKRTADKTNKEFFSLLLPYSREVHKVFFIVAILCVFLHNKDSWWRQRSAHFAIENNDVKWVLTLECARFLRGKTFTSNFCGIKLVCFVKLCRGFWGCLSL